MANYNIETVLNMQNGLQASAVVPVGDKIFTLGGSSDDGVTTRVQEYNPSENTIKTVANLQTAVWLASGAAVGNKIYLFGGIGALNKIQVFDVDTYTVETLSTQLPENNSGAVAVAAGTDIYVFGGYGNAKDTYRKTILKFNTVTNSISTLSATLQTGLENAAGALIGDKIYILGGYATSKLNEIIQVFDTTTQKVSTLSQNIAFPCNNPSYAALGKTIFLFGGTSPEYGNGSNVIQAFDTETLTVYTLSATLPDAAYRIGASAVGNSIYLFGGRTASVILTTINKFYDESTSTPRPTTTTITYNGKAIATLSPGQKATLNCAGKKMVGDITIATADETTDGSVFGEEVATTG